MLYSKSKPAPQTEVVGSWFSWTKDELISKLAEGSTIAGLCGPNRSGHLQFIYMPTSFTNSNGEKDVIGNIYNEKGQFGLLQIQGSELGYGYVIEEYASIPDFIRPSKPLPKKSLEGTPWSESKVDLGIVACPLAVPFFFGSDIVQASVFDDDFNLKMQGVSEQHGIWASLISEAFNQFEHRSIIEHLVEKKLGKKSAEYITPAFDTELISDCFPYCFITPFVTTDQAKNEQKAIATYFKPVVQPDVANPFQPNMNQAQFQQQLQQQIQQCTQIMALQQQSIANANQQPTQIIVESKADKAKEKEAKLNATMLCLLFVGGDFDSFKKRVDLVNLRVPTYTTVMLNILDEPSAVKYVQAANILRTVFDDEPANLAERLSPLFTELSMHHFSRNFVAAFINCNFQPSNFETLDYEPQAISILHFAKQDDTCQVNEAKRLEEEQRNERDFDFSEAHRKQMKTTITPLGKVESMKDIGHVAANLAATIRAFFDVDSGAVPILYQLAMKVIETINQKKFKLWVDKYGPRMPHLPFVFLNMLQHVLGRMMVFAQHTINIQTIDRGDDGSNLKSDIACECGEHIVRFFNKMDEHIADATVPKDAPIWYNSNLVEAPASGITAATPARQTQQGKAAEASKSPSASPAKKKSKGLKPTGKADQEKLGLFIAKDGANITEFFPPGLEMEKQPCAFFCVKGKKCNKSRIECPRAHLASWKEFGTNDAIRERNQAKVLAHFKDKKLVWFCAETMSRHKATLPDEYQFLLGDASGPKSM